jgi:glycosyltransferase involved in cell wall biosynthesis
VIDLPESFVLYQGPPGDRWLLRLLEAWRWAAGAVGQDYPLFIPGLDPSSRGRLIDLLEDFDLGETVLAPADFPVEAVPLLYQRCAALFHPAPLSPWGGPVRHALACGRPVVAAESPLADAIVGPAAYLVPPDDPRTLGAALITVIVEEEVAEKLKGAALDRAAAWRDLEFGARLAAAYETIL